MPEDYFGLSASDRTDVLELGAQRTGRPTYLLEKDIWVVRCLELLYSQDVGRSLTFKGGTSLSKCFGAIRRFSEDIDLTCDIRELVPEAVDFEGGLPRSRSKAVKWRKQVESNIPVWVAENVLPCLRAGLRECDLIAEDELVRVLYPAGSEASTYVGQEVRLEFGGRATGEPHQLMQVQCDIADAFPDVAFPEARPLTMQAERTFWEKATAIHVFASGGRFRGRDAFARHWYDLVALDEAGIAEAALARRDIAEQVARHKSLFFREKVGDGHWVDYAGAVDGGLRLIPEALEARIELEADYAKMREAGLFEDEPPDSQRCARRLDPWRSAPTALRRATGRRQRRQHDDDHDDAV